MSKACKAFTHARLDSSPLQGVKFSQFRREIIFDRHPGVFSRHPGASRMPAEWNSLPVGHERMPADGKSLPVEYERLPAEENSLPAEYERMPAEHPGEAAEQDGQGVAAATP